MHFALARLFGGIVIATVLLSVAIAIVTLATDRRDRIQRESDEATGGVGERAIPIMMANGCSGCHTIPGVPGAQGQVGPRLDASLADRVMKATEHEREIQTRLRATEDFKEGVKAMAERRVPNFVAR